jgi:hypothetical protein
MEEHIVNAGRDINIASDFDWMAEGASHLVNEMIAYPELATSSTQKYIQRYLLELC